LLYLFPISFLVGLAVGSFLNVVIDRLPRGDSLVSPPSHCESCGHPLGPRDLIPIWSFLRLRGRCRFCAAPIPRRLPLVEGLTGTLYLALTVRYGWSPELLRALSLLTLLIPIFFIDLEHYMIPDGLSGSLALLGLLLSPIGPGLLPALLGGACGFIVLLLPYLVYRKGLGGGDVKLAGALGLVLGFPQVFLCLTLSFLGGSLVAGGLLASRRRRRRDPIPFAPFLATGAMLTLLYGKAILEWYTGLF